MHIGADVSNATEKLEIIMGKGSLEKLAASSVLVLGCGGVGSNCIEALARGGVGKLIIVDHDTIAESNINRQQLHSTQHLVVQRLRLWKR